MGLRLKDGENLQSKKFGYFRLIYIFVDISDLA